jgi:ubiquinone/menaquinone biosynthesis C-methylase UbiE
VKRILLALLAVGCAAAGQAPARGQRANVGEQADYKKISDTADALELKEGSQVADVGAGDGAYEEELSKRVGSTGRVYAVDIDEKRAIPKLKTLVENKSLTNVTVVVGEPANPKLPDASLDAVLIVNAYHEMTAYKEILSHLRTALKPGGRLVVVDSLPLPGTASSSRADQSRRHNLAADFAEAEFREAGLEIIERRDKFVLNKNGAPTRWMIIARNPQ